MKYFCQEGILRANYGTSSVKLILKDGNNKTLSETTNTIEGLTLEEKTFDTKGKVVTQFNFEYDEKGVLMKIVDKDGVTSLTEEFLAKEGAIIE